jgi:hypothetical protein
MRGYIKYRDAGQIEAIDVVRDLPTGTSIGSMLGLATSLHNHSNAGVVEYGLLDFEHITVNVGTLVTGADVHNKGRTHFTYTTDNNETVSVTLWIPSPMMNNYSFIEGVGYRMHAAAGEILKVGLIDLIGQADLQFSYGVLDYRESEKGARHGSCLQFQDESQNSCWMGVPQPVSAAALQAFQAIVGPFSMCQCIDGVYVNPTVVVVPTGDPLLDTTEDDLGFDSVETRALMKFRYQQGTRKKTMSLMLPAIKTSRCTSGEGGRGYKVGQVYGEGIALSVTALYGSSNRNATFKSGKIDVKNLQNQ